MKQIYAASLPLMLLFISQASIGWANDANEPEKPKPACEIKLLIDSSRILDENHLLNESIREQLGIREEYQTIRAVYLDTPERSFLDAGWANRIRQKQGKTKYAITYKKRYAILNNDIETALASALKDGFTPGDSRFAAKIDWGYSNMTLSFSSDIEIKIKELPDITKLTCSDAIRMLTDHMPLEEKKNTSVPESIQPVGPIEFLRYSGVLNGEKIRIEVWPIADTGGLRYIVELSAKYENPEEAAAIRNSFIIKLDEMGILIHRDALKTRLILNGLDTLKD